MLDMLPNFPSYNVGDCHLANVETIGKFLLLMAIGILTPNFNYILLGQHRSPIVASRIALWGSFDWSFGCMSPRSTGGYPIHGAGVDSMLTRQVRYVRAVFVFLPDLLSNAIRKLSSMGLLPALKSIRVKSWAAPISLGLSSLGVTLPYVEKVASWFEMFTTLARGPITFVKRAIRECIGTILNEMSNAMRSHSILLLAAISIAGELSVTVLILCARPSPTISLRPLTGTLINLTPESRDVLLGQWRQRLGVVEWLAFCFRLSSGHVFDLLERSLDGPRGVTSTSRPSPILTQQLRGYA